jgi:putative phage-type endonuclease
VTAPTTARRVTPTGVRVLPADADRDAWLAARRRGVGSSDVPAILGLAEAKNKTALHVWHDKRGELTDEDNEPMLWGRLLEEPVAREWARRNRSVVQRVGLIAHANEPWQMATLDRQVAECPLNREVRTRCALEVKCRNAYTSSRWRADLPDDVLAQTTWQRHVTGFDHIHVAVLIGGNDYRQTVVRADEQVTGYVLDTVGAFYRDHMLPGVPPPADLSKAEALNALDEMLHPDRFGEVAIDGVMEVVDYVRLADAESAAKKEREAARAILAQQANGARYVMHEGRLLYEFGPTTRSKCDLDRLAERWPDAYADCVTERTSYTIRVDRAFRASAKNRGTDGE